MGIVGQGVEKQIGQLMPRQMLVRRQLGCENQPAGIDTARLGLRAQIVGGR